MKLHICLIKKAYPNNKRNIDLSPNFKGSILNL